MLGVPAPSGASNYLRKKQLRISNVRCYGKDVTYYRYHHGENKLSPRQQQDILQIRAKFGPTDGLAFDHYETAFNFG